MHLPVGDGYDEQRFGAFGEDDDERESSGPGAADAVAPWSVAVRHGFDLGDEPLDLCIEMLGYVYASIR